MLYFILKGIREVFYNDFKNNKVGLSDRLKELRENKGLTQQEFAELLDLSRVSVGAYEKGTAIPNTETLIKISNNF